MLAETAQAILYFAPEGVVINRIPSGKIQQERRSGFVNPTRSGMDQLPFANFAIALMMGEFHRALVVSIQHSYRKSDSSASSTSVPP